MKTARFLICLTLATLASTDALAKMYKWVDEQGNVHYSDKIPPSAIKGSHSALNQEGVTVEKTGAAKSPEEIARDQAIKKMQEEQAKKLAEEKAKEKVLLNSFRTEDDIILTRDGKLATYDAQIRIVYENIERLKARLLTLQNKAATAERQGRQLDKATADGIRSSSQEIKDSYASIVRQENDKKLITGKAAEDLAMFRKLKEREKSALAQTHANAEVQANVQVETIIKCDSDQHCDELWSKARSFATKQQVTPVYADSDKIYMTRPPEKEGEIAIAVSRLQPMKDEGEVIFLDVQCLKEKATQTWCESPKATEMRAAFRSAMAK